MGITTQNLPYWCLLWIGIGFAIILIGVFMLANSHSRDMQYTQRLEKVFPMLVEQKQKDYGAQGTDQNNLYEQIHSLSNEGKTPEEIAKQLKIGVGEVKLMISLYTMR